MIDRLCSNPGVAAAAAVASTAGDGRHGPTTHQETPPRCGQWTDRWSVLGTAAVLPPTPDGNQGSLPIAAGGGAGRRSPKHAGRPLNLEYR